MKRTAIISLAGLVVSAGIVVTDGVPAVAAGTGNLIKNGNAEQGTGSGNGRVVPVPDWTDSTGTSFTAVKYGAKGGGFPTATSPGPGDRGLNFFAGGPNDPNDSVTATQTVNLASFVNAIKGGHVTARLTGWLGGSGTRTDQAFVEVDFKNKNGFLVGSSMVLAGVTESVRGGQTEFVRQLTTAAVPKNARSAFVQLSFSRQNGQTYNLGFVDNVGLVLLGT